MGKHRRPKLLIIVMFQNLADEPPYYMKMWVPPATGPLIAALTPPSIDVEVLHEMVRPIDWSTDAEYVGLSFWNFHAPHAFEVARRFRQMGKIVIAGGRYPTSNPDECQAHFDSVVVGSALTVWPQAVDDLLAGRLQPRYTEPLDGPPRTIPPPRYELAERRFPFPVSTEASGGCRYACRFCQLTVDDERFRRINLRPIDDVITDLTATRCLPFYSRRLANLVDNNLASVPSYAKALLRRIAALKLWGLLTQFSIDALHDDEFVEALVQSRCVMAFVGLESMLPESLDSINKHQNKQEEYAALLGKLKQNGIVSFCGLILGLDGDTTEYYRQILDRIDEAGPDVLMLSIVAPIQGTDWAAELRRDNRILDDDVSHYDGDHIIVRPLLVTPGEVLDTYGRVLRSFYSWMAIGRRYLRFLRARPLLGLAPKAIARTVIGTLVFWHLTLLYRHHARARVRRIVERGVIATAGA